MNAARHERRRRAAARKAEVLAALSTAVVCAVCGTVVVQVAGEVMACPRHPFARHTPQDPLEGHRLQICFCDVPRLEAHACTRTHNSERD